MLGKLGASVLVVGLASVLLSMCTDDSDNPWDTCKGYRKDVVAGSAQDLRDLRELKNPCY